MSASTPRPASVAIEEAGECPRKQLQGLLSLLQLSLGQLVLAQGAAVLQVLAQNARGPLAEPYAALGIDAAPHGDDGIEVGVFYPAADLAHARGAKSGPPASQSPARVLVLAETKSQIG